MDEQFCAVCSVPCTQSCGKCKNVSYCSKDHQSNHWREHKKDCHPFKIVTHPDKGRVLIATKDMDPYSIIIQEQSIINLPNGKEDTAMLGKVCISCCKVSENLKCCSKCSAPVCGTDCELAEIHASYECKVFSSGSSYRRLTTYSKLMAIIRCLLLKSRDRKKYDVLMTLQSNLDHFLADKNYAEIYRENSMSVQLILKEVGLEEYDRDEIGTVMGIIDTNSMAATTRSSMHLYAKTSIASHSCVRNARPIIDNTGRMKLIATRPIVAGEEITIANAGLNEGTVERQKKIRTCYHFFCKCTRCEDPTELGTNFSSVKCRQCPDGYLVPKYQWDSKQDLETEVLWMCNGCSQKNTEAQIQELLAPIHKEAVEIQSTSANGMKTVKKFEALIAKYSGNILHPNHYLLFIIENTFTEMMCAMINLEVESKIKLSRKDIAYLKEIVVSKCMKWLDVSDILFPGPIEIRGRILAMLWKGTQDDKMAAFMALPRKKKRVIPEWIKEVISIAEEAVQIISLEPDGDIYNDWINDLNGWIRSVQQ